MKDFPLQKTNMKVVKIWSIHQHFICMYQQLTNSHYFFLSSNQTPSIVISFSGKGFTGCFSLVITNRLLIILVCTISLFLPGYSFFQFLSVWRLSFEKILRFLWVLLGSCVLTRGWESGCRGSLFNAQGANGLFALWS